MAEYYDLPYTGAEVAADLAKIHDKTSLVEEAPTDGKEYVRKNGGWVDLGLGDLSSVVDLANGEIVTVNLTNNQNADISYSGAVVHVVYDSEDHTYSVSGSSVVFVVPNGRTYTVSVSGGIYTSSESQTYTAGSASRDITIEVTINTGVYIQDTDGNLYTSDTWDTANNDNANGVAVILSTCRFVIVPNVNSTAKWASTANVNLTAINKTTTNTAKADYNGKSNTATMLTNTNCKASGCAAYVCANTTSKRGKKGYLGAVGEMYAIYQNRATINTLLTLIGGTSIGTGSYWTSDQYYASSKYYAWRVTMSSGGVTNQTQTTSNYIRVLTEL